MYCRDGISRKVWKQNSGAQGATINYAEVLVSEKVRITGVLLMNKKKYKSYSFRRQSEIVFEMYLAGDSNLKRNYVFIRVRQSSYVYSRRSY